MQKALCFSDFQNWSKDKPFSVWYPLKGHKYLKKPATESIFK